MRVLYMYVCGFNIYLFICRCVCIDKLRHLSKMMRTERGKELAKKRDSFMKDFVEHVQQEYDLVM